MHEKQAKSRLPESRRTFKTSYGVRISRRTNNKLSPASAFLWTEAGFGGAGFSGKSAHMYPPGPPNLAWVTIRVYHPYHALSKIAKSPFQTSVRVDHRAGLQPIPIIGFQPGKPFLKYSGLFAKGRFQPSSRNATNLRLIEPTTSIHPRMIRGLHDLRAFVHRWATLTNQVPGFASATEMK